MSSPMLLVRVILHSSSLSPPSLSIDNRSRKVIAMKIIDLEEAEDEIEDIQQEIAVLSQCDSPHVTRYFGSYLKVSSLSLSLSPLALLHVITNIRLKSEIS